MITTIQKNIKKYLRINSMSVSDLEKRTGLKHSVINILYGRSKNPSVRLAYAIAHELNCSVEDLLKEEDSEQNDHYTLNKCQYDNLYDTDDNFDSKNIWDPVLTTDCLSCLNKTLSVNNLRPSLDQAFLLLKKIVRYTQLENNQKIEERFVDWLIKHYYPSLSHIKQ